MGFRISWYAVKGRPKAYILGLVGLEDTGIPVEVPESPFSVTEFPKGWVIVWSNDFDFASAEHMALASRSDAILSCQVHEGIMYAAARWHDHGREIWSVSHDSFDGRYDLDVSGSPPHQFAGIRHRQLELQRDEEIQRSGPLRVDYVWDIPVMLAQSICGRRHDLLRYDWGQPKFTMARRGPTN